MTSVDLARAGDAGDAGQDAEGNLDVDVLQVVLRGADDRQTALPACAPLSRHRDGAARRRGTGR